MKKFRLRTGDKVVVLSGKFKKMTGEIMAIDRNGDRVFLKGVNVVKRHARASMKNPEGMIEKEASLHISNVAFYDEKAGAASRIGYKFEKGEKKRYLKKSGELVG